jgi:23S rRNA A2030 N6-methylase RlmJ
MPYDHADKIGNEGDVAKHAVLAAVVDHFLQKKPTTFAYAESHTGYAEYTLPREGNWRDGIGFLSDATHANCRVALQPYRTACFPSPLRPFDRYPGSSGLVFRMVRSCGAFSFTLYEVNPAACHDLALHFPFFEQCRIRREDGIRGMLSLESASLVLVDPPDLDRRQELVELLNVLDNRSIPFICWTPRNSGHFKDGWREGNPSTEFYNATAKHSQHRVRWEADWQVQGMRGCQITTPKQFQKITSAVLDALCTVMPNWIRE